MQDSAHCKVPRVVFHKEGEPRVVQRFAQKASIPNFWAQKVRTCSRMKAIFSVFAMAPKVSCRGSTAIYINPE